MHGRWADACSHEHPIIRLMSVRLEPHARIVAVAIAERDRVAAIKARTSRVLDFTQRGGVGTASWTAGRVE
jgi:hypothetical protein